MDVAVVGAGRVGTALALLLRRAGHRIIGVSGREATTGRAARHLPDVPVSEASVVARDAELVLIAVPDDAIATTCEAIAAAGAFGPGQLVAHCSGALGVRVLAAARDAGARVLSLHPLQTFPDVDAAVAALPGVTVAVTALEPTAAEEGERIVRDLGAVPVRIDDDRTALYHAAAVFASNYVVAVTALAEDLFARAGLDEPLERFLPLTRATVDNVAALGTEPALTGPAVRGDAGTIRRNLDALAASAPDAIPAYVALARVALDLGERSGRLAAVDRARVDLELDRWS
jgi:predicted short-subunit dehydrogenase-like oxidoreductase (DUF2520 family)